MLKFKRTIKATISSAFNIVKAVCMTILLTVACLPGLCMIANVMGYEELAFDIGMAFFWFITYGGLLA